MQTEIEFPTLTETNVTKALLEVLATLSHSSNLSPEEEESFRNTIRTIKNSQFNLSGQLFISFDLLVAFDLKDLDLKANLIIAAARIASVHGMGAVESRVLSIVNQAKRIVKSGQADFPLMITPAK